MESSSIRLLYSCFFWCASYASRSSDTARIRPLTGLDYGSDVLSDDPYVQSVREILGTPAPDERIQKDGVAGSNDMIENERQGRVDRRTKAQKWRSMENNLRSELSADNREKLMQLSRDFAPLALGLRKIWTFVEAYGTNIKVLSGGSKEGEELEMVELSVSFPPAASYHRERDGY